MKLFDSLVSIYQFRADKKLVAEFQKAVGYFQSNESPDKDFFELLSKAVENWPLLSQPESQLFRKLCQSGLMGRVVGKVFHLFGIAGMIVKL